MSVFDVIVVGCRPGRAGHRDCRRQHALSHLVLEKGALVNTLLHFPTNMVFFTTPELLEIGGLPFVTPYDKPTRPRGAALLPPRRRHLHLPIAFGEDVEGVTPRPATAAVSARATRSAAARAREPTLRARSSSPPAPTTCRTCSASMARTCRTSHTTTPRRIPTTASASSSSAAANSAADAALELYRAGAHVTIVHRGADFARVIKYWVRPDL